MSGHRVQFADLPPSDHKGNPKSHTDVFSAADQDDSTVCLRFALPSSLNLSLSGHCVPECWNGYPLSISEEERVNRSEREEDRESTRGQ
ncbi:hypothetical protein F2P81_019112 [Scophthalmus maximus]|uniref:Uncharacterized protein n=1 Tax=Scophthalmus maximus TaxID=52904 RepID=A0A6A4S6X9_SCOMX|nr:hypothetical protein F2P81_019112 [Scophthalmus maximus]